MEPLALPLQLGQHHGGQVVAAVAERAPLRCARLVPARGHGVPVGFAFVDRHDRQHQHVHRAHLVAHVLERAHPAVEAFAVALLEPHRQVVGEHRAHQRVGEVAQIHRVLPQRLPGQCARLLDRHQQLCGVGGGTVPQGTVGVHEPVRVVEVPPVRGDRDGRVPVRRKPRHVADLQRAGVVEVGLRMQRAQVFDHAAVARVGAGALCAHVRVFAQHAHAYPGVGEQHRGDLRARRGGRSPAQHAVGGEPVRLVAVFRAVRSALLL